MLKASFPFLITILVFACNSAERFPTPEDAQDAGRIFIRAALDGDYEKAEHYLLKDSVNTMIFNKWQHDMYDKLSTEERVKYKEANILPIKIENENDSSVNYSFTNTYKNKDTTTIKIVRLNDNWMIDLKNIH